MAGRTFVAYYRVSTKGQGVSGLGLEAQEAAVLRHLDGGELVGEYRDVETGTRKGNDRPELRKALAHAKREKATLVIAVLDRLARNVHFISGLMESGVPFVAADRPNASPFELHIYAAMAEEEARKISARTKAALAAARERGTKLGKPENLTYEARVKGSQATKGKAVAAYATQAGNIVSLKEHGMSFREIAAHLNERGEMTRGGAVFLATTVKRIYDRAKAEGMGR